MEKYTDFDNSKKSEEQPKTITIEKIFTEKSEKYTTSRATFNPNQYNISVPDVALRSEINNVIETVKSAIDKYKRFEKAYRWKSAIKRRRRYH